MAKKPTGKPNGRPRKEIDQKQFENLCALQCTEEEIAGFFECSVDTINLWCKRMFGCTFTETYKEKSQAGKISLRRFQYKLAEKNPGMAIFLGKNWLGQTDKSETTVMEVENLAPLAAMLRDDEPVENPVENDFENNEDLE